MKLSPGYSVKVIGFTGLQEDPETGRTRLVTAEELRALQDSGRGIHYNERRQQLELRVPKGAPLTKAAALI